MKDLKSLKPIYEHLLKDADETVDPLEPGDEKDELQRQIDDVKRRWTAVDDKANKRDEVIDKVAPRAKDYHDQRQKFVSWIVEPEKTVKNLEAVPTTVEELIDLRRKVEVRSINDRSYDMILTNATKFPSE